MPAPFNVQPAPGAQGAGVIFNDSAGNETINGSLTIGGVERLAAQATAPLQTPGYVTLYSPDGVGLSSVSGGGVTSIVSAGVPGSGGLDWLNVKAFGAAGNGTTDDTAAITAALAAVPSNGGVVYFPAGNYLITSGLKATVNGTRMVGDGWGSRIQYDGSVVATAVSATGNIRLFMSDLRISQLNASHLGTAVDLSNTNSGVVERLLIDGGGASGVAPLTGISLAAATCHYVVVRDCRINYGGAGAKGVNISAAAHSNTVQDCHMVPQGDDVNSSGVYINGTHSILLIRPDIEAAAGNGIFMDTGANGNTVVHGYCDSNNINLKITSGVIALTVLGGTYENGTTANVQNNGAVGLQILNAWPNSGTNSYNHLEIFQADLFSVTGTGVAVSTAGQGLLVKEGANAKQGTVALVAGVSVTANTSVTANSRIFLTSQVDSGTPGFLRVQTRVPGSSFTIVSSSNTDTSTVAYQIFEPA